MLAISKITDEYNYGISVDVFTEWLIKNAVALSLT